MPCRYGAPAAVYQHAAAPAPPAAPTYPSQQQQQQATAAPAVYQPAAAAPAAPPAQVYQPSGSGALPSPTMPAPPTAPPPVYQPAAAPAAAAAAVPQVYQPAAVPGGFTAQRAGSLTAAAQPSPTFVPQQGPAEAAAAAAAAFGQQLPGGSHSRTHCYGGRPWRGCGRTAGRSYWGPIVLPPASASCFVVLCSVTTTVYPSLPPCYPDPAAGAPLPAAPAKPQPPAPPPGPPANVTIQNVDTSKVGPELRPIVNTLMALHQVRKGGPYPRIAGPVGHGCAWR